MNNKKNYFYYIYNLSFYGKFYDFKIIIFTFKIIYRILMFVKMLGRYILLNIFLLVYFEKILLLLLFINKIILLKCLFLVYFKEIVFFNIFMIFKIVIFIVKLFKKKIFFPVFLEYAYIRILIFCYICVDTYCIIT